MTPIRLLHEAEEELRVAAQSYEKAQPGLGRAFVDQVRRTTSLIAEFPLAVRVERGEIRIRSIARFPYRIYSVGHCRRRPGFWRLREES